MKKTLLAITATTVFALSSTAQARTDAFCLQKGPGPGDCKYATYAQCAAALSGTDGVCQANPGVTEGGSSAGGWIPHGPNERPIGERTTGSSRR